MIAAARVGACVVLAMLAPVACAHPEHPEIETSSGGGEPPCVVTRDIGSSGDSDTTPAEIAGTYAWRMVPGVATEIDVDLGVGGWMAATFESPGVPLEWDIHSHDGDEVVVHARGDDVAGFAELDAPAPGIYSFFWRNPGPGDADLCVQLRLSGDAALHGA